MANLIFKGHATRGKELHKLLEYLGGVDAGYSTCCCVTSFYYINREGYIEGSIFIPDYMNHRIIMSLETFESKYPYKVGDKVNYVKYNDGYPSVYTIQGVRWTGVTIEYLLDSSGFSALTKDLQPYKEETMEKEISGAIIDRFICLEGFEFYDDKGNIINTKEIIMKKKKPKYPKTYEECCKVLDWNPRDYDRTGYKFDLLCKLQVLLICRDAYWNIAGEEIGLGKPWEYDCNRKYYTHAIICRDGYIQKVEVIYRNAILTFPTAEMRDAFYENFKELIEECKELL